VGAPFSQDAITGGTTVSDPDGDSLTYVVALSVTDAGAGGGRFKSRSLRNIALRGPEGLNLSETDKLALIAFLGTLTDTALVQDPKFSNPF